MVFRDVCVWKSPHFSETLKPIQTDAKDRRFLSQGNFNMFTAIYLIADKDDNILSLNFEHCRMTIIEQLSFACQVTWQNLKFHFLALSPFIKATLSSQNTPSHFLLGFVQGQQCSCIDFSFCSAAGIRVLSLVSLSLLQCFLSSACCNFDFSCLPRVCDLVELYQQ